MMENSGKVDNISCNQYTEYRRLTLCCHIDLRRLILKRKYFMIGRIKVTLATWRAVTVTVTLLCPRVFIGLAAISCAMIGLKEVVNFLPWPCRTLSSALTTLHRVKFSIYTNHLWLDYYVTGCHLKTSARISLTQRFVTWSTRPSSMLSSSSGMSLSTIINGRLARMQEGVSRIGVPFSRIRRYRKLTRKKIKSLFSFLP